MPVGGERNFKLLFLDKVKEAAALAHGVKGHRSREILVLLYLDPQLTGFPQASSMVVPYNLTLFFHRTRVYTGVLGLGHPSITCSTFPTSCWSKILGLLSFSDKVAL
jgi:hypothetical protein